MPKIAAWIAAASLAVIALGLVIFPYSMAAVYDAQHKENLRNFERASQEIAREPTADETFKAVADSL